MEAVNTVAVDAKNFVASLSIDVLTLAALTGIFLLIGLNAGKSRLISFIFSSYVAALLIISFPYAEKITYDLGLLLDKYNLIWLILLLVVVFAIQVAIDYVLEFDYSGERFINILILAASSTVALLASAYISKVVVNTDPSVSFLDKLFTGEQTLFFLLLAPLIGVFLVAR